MEGCVNIGTLGQIATAFVIYNISAEYMGELGTQIIPTRV